MIVSHTPHFRNQERLVAWGPTVREIDQLGRVFAEIVHVAPLHDGPAPRSCLPYTSKSVEFHPVRPSGGPSAFDKLSVLRVLPHYWTAVWRASKWADVAHVRCPASISLAAVLLFSLRPGPARRWVKYAGNWQPKGGEPISYKLQRSMLAHRLHRGTVTVNGEWPNQPRHIYSFVNPSFLSSEIASARELGLQKKLTAPAKLLFVGRLEHPKGAGRAVSIAARLKDLGLPFTLDVVGDGAERPALDLQALSLGLEDRISFHGWVSRDDLSLLYSRAHFLLLPSSASEGWPKVVSEAMAYGAVPIAGAVSCIPQTLESTHAGFALQPDDVAGFALTIRRLFERPAEWSAASRAGIQAAAQFGYDHYLSAVREMFWDAWGDSLPHPTEQMNEAAHHEGHKQL
jgi:glycosyltransferase involved in cell wall biosynthesis